MPDSPKAWLILACLGGPAASVFLLALIGSQANGDYMLPVILLCMALGSLVGGSAAGILFARRIAGHSSGFIGIAVLLAFCGIAVSAALCFGGCLAGLFGGDKFL